VKSADFVSDHCNLFKYIYVYIDRIPVIFLSHFSFHAIDIFNIWYLPDSYLDQFIRNSREEYPCCVCIVVVIAVVVVVVGGGNGRSSGGGGGGRRLLILPVIPSGPAA
jgi:hypothetical protein